LFVNSTNHYPDDQREKNEVGGRAVRMAREERFIQGFGGGDLWERGDMEDLGLNSVIIFKCILKYGVYWFDLVGDRGQ